MLGHFMNGKKKSIRKINCKRDLMEICKLNQITSEVVELDYWDSLGWPKDDASALKTFDETNASIIDDGPLFSTSRNLSGEFAVQVSQRYDAAEIEAKVNPSLETTSTFASSEEILSIKANEHELDIPISKMSEKRRNNLLKPTLLDGEYQAANLEEKTRYQLRTSPDSLPHLSFLDCQENSECLGTDRGCWRLLEDSAEEFSSHEWSLQKPKTRMRRILMSESQTNTGSKFCPVACTMSNDESCEYDSVISNDNVSYDVPLHREYRTTNGAIAVSFSFLTAPPTCMPASKRQLNEERTHIISRDEKPQISVKELMPTRTVISRGSNKRHIHFTATKNVQHRQHKRRHEEIEEAMMLKHGRISYGRKDKSSALSFKNGDAFSISAQTDAEKAIIFSQRQTNEIELFVSMLLRRLRYTRTSIEEALLCEPRTLMCSLEKVRKSSITRDFEEFTRKWLHSMKRDCLRFSKIMKLSSNLDVHLVTGSKKQRKIMFADEIGGVLCDVKTLDEDCERVSPKMDSDYA